VNGGFLPSARTVSNNVLQYTSGGMTPVSAVHSMHLTHHGQFIDHDIISTPTELGKHRYLKKNAFLVCIQFSCIIKWLNIIELQKHPRSENH
jgi:hypothetical protein